MFLLFLQAFHICCLLTSSDCLRCWSRNMRIRMNSRWLQSRLHHLAPFRVLRSIESSSDSLILRCEIHLYLLKISSLVESWFYICYKFSVNWILQVCLAIRQWNLICYAAFQLSFKVQSCVTAVTQLWQLLLNCYWQLNLFESKYKTYKWKWKKDSRTQWKVFSQDFKDVISLIL